MNVELESLQRLALTRIRRQLLPFLFALYVVAYIDRVNMSFAIHGLERDLSISMAEYGLSAGVFFIGYVLFEVPSNLILERIGARPWISRIMISWGILAALTALVNNVEQLHILRFFLGFAEAGFVPGIVLYLSRWVPRAERSLVLSSFIAAIPVAGLIGAPIAAALLSLDGWLGISGWRWLFLMEALPAICLGLLVWHWLPNRPSDASWLPKSEALAIENAIATEQEDKLHSLRKALTQSRLWLLCLLALSIAIGCYSFSFWIPNFVANDLPRASETLVSLISALPYAIAVPIMLLVGKSSDRQHEQSLHVAVPLLIGACSLFAVIHTTGGVRLLALCIATAATFAALGPFWTLPTVFLGGTAAAGGIAWINSFANIGGFIAPYVMGQLLSQTSGQVLALNSLAAVLLVGALLALNVKG